MTDPDALTALLYRLQDLGQRATYGAVAGVVGGHPRSLMRGRPRDPLHSWVVNAQTGRPTHYRDDEMHAALFANDHVIADAAELRRLLDAA